MINDHHHHHIIPLHAGGTDDPSNIELVTVEQHSERHRVLWEQYGRWQDKLAWLALSGQIGKEEIIKQKQTIPNIGRRLSEKSRKQISNKLLGGILSEDHKKKIQKGVVLKYSDPVFREDQRVAASRPGTSNPFYGHKHSEDFKKSQSIRRSKHYVCISPNGEVFDVFNLSEFCKFHNLNRGNMGTGGTKGWTCTRRVL